MAQPIYFNCFPPRAEPNANNVFVTLLWNFQFTVASGKISSNLKLPGHCLIILSVETINTRWCEIDVNYNSSSSWSNEYSNAKLPKARLKWGSVSGKFPKFPQTSRKPQTAENDPLSEIWLRYARREIFLPQHSDRGTLPQTLQTSKPQ